MPIARVAGVTVGYTAGCRPRSECRTCKLHFTIHRRERLWRPARRLEGATRVGPPGALLAATSRQVVFEDHRNILVWVLWRLSSSWRPPDFGDRDGVPAWAAPSGAYAGEGAGVGDGAEPVRERRAVFEGLERGLAVGVVVGRAVGGGIIDAADLPKIVDAARLLAGSQPWTPADAAGQRAWFQDSRHGDWYPGCSPCAAGVLRVLLLPCDS